MADAHAVIGATDVGPVDVHDIGLGPIRLGGMLFTMIDPARGHEATYNRWYERDHLMAGCTLGPYCWAAKRWVAPRAYKDLRYVDGDMIAADPMQGSYLSLYWLLADYMDEWNRWAFREFRWLHANGRMYQEREHVHTLMYTHDWAQYRDEDPIPSSLALDHPFAGVAVTVGQAADDDREAFDTWSREELLPDLQGEGSPVAMTLSFSAVPLQVEAKDVAKDDGSAGRFMLLHFLQEDPLDCWGDTVGKVPAAIAEAGAGRVAWNGVFIPTIPGTDTYTDDLW